MQIILCAISIDLWFDLISFEEKKIRVMNMCSNVCINSGKSVKYETKTFIINIYIFSGIHVL